MRRMTLVGAGFFAAWAVHDTEELLTMGTTSRALAASAPSWLPLPPDIRRDGYSPAHFRVALAVMAAVTATAAADGIRTQGRSPFFRAGLDAFGWHGVGHVVAALALRRYVSGVATAPVVVIGYWLWARRSLARDGAPVTGTGLRSALAVPPILLVAHGVARALTRSSR